MFERFSTGARQAVAIAQEEARALHHPTIGTEHLLIAVAGQSTSAAGRALKSKGLDAAQIRAAVLRMVGDPLDGRALATLGIDLEQVRKAAEGRFGVGALNPAPPGRTVTGHIPLSGRAKRVLALSTRAAQATKADSITTEHLLIAMIDEGEGLAARVLRQEHLDLVALRAELVAASGDAAA